MDPTTVKIIDPTTGNPVTTLTVPNEGVWTVDPTTGKITFTPEAGFTGDPTPITYVVSDRAGNTSTPVAVNVDYPEEELDSDNDGIPDNIDLDDDNDGIPDTIEENGTPNLDTDGDGVPDRLDLDSDNDGILDLLESGQDVATVDTNNDGVLDSTSDTDNDGLMDTADADDNDANSKGIVTPLDTDEDGKPDFQDVDSDNDGLSDMVEAGISADNDADSDGMIDNPAVDANGVATVVDPVISPLNTDGDTLPNYRDLDSDNDGLSDVNEIGGLDENDDGLVDIEGSLVDGTTIPDSDGDNIPDVLEVADGLQEDHVVSDLSEPVTVNVLENDQGDLDSSTVKIELPEGFMEAHPDAVLSDDGKTLVVPNEGTWRVNSDGTITYTAEKGTSIVNPTPISYSVETTDGQRLETDTKIVLSQSVVADATDTNCTEICEDYEDNVSIYSSGTILLVILLGSLFGVFLFRQER